MLLIYSLAIVGGISLVLLGSIAWSGVVRHKETLRKKEIEKARERLIKASRRRL